MHISLLHSVEISLRFIQLPRAGYAVRKQSERQVDYSVSFSAEVKTTWSGTTILIHVFMASFLIKHRQFYIHKRIIN
jgi:hypothetical protein